MPIYTYLVVLRTYNAGKVLLFELYLRQLFIVGHFVLILKKNHRSIFLRSHFSRSACLISDLDESL